MTDIVAASSDSPHQHLITLALEKNAEPSVLSRLMDLQERWEASQARKAFVLAMTAFKQEAPAVMAKTCAVDFTSAKGSRTNYRYANLGSIVQEITVLLGKHELSATWNTKQEDNGNITVTCYVTHSAGHRESVTLSGPPDMSGNKNPIQSIGSTVTYLQRYTLLAALGLATGEDDDGRGGPSSDGQHEPLKQPAAPSVNQAATAPAPSCPKCSGAMWDNRAKKAEGKLKPNAPDYKCKTGSCNGLYWPGQWPPKEESAATSGTPDNCPKDAAACPETVYDQDGKPECTVAGHEGPCPH